MINSIYLNQVYSTWLNRISICWPPSLSLQILKYKIPGHKRNKTFNLKLIFARTSATLPAIRVLEMKSYIVLEI